MPSESRREYQRAYYLKNKDRIRRRQDLQVKANWGRIYSYRKAWRKANSEKVREWERKYKNSLPRESVNAKHRDWCKRNPAKIKAKSRRFYVNHRAEIRARHKQWCENNPHRISAASMKRRALKAKATVNLRQITNWISSIKGKHEAVCYYCGGKILVGPNAIHFDHIIPLSRGGPHSVENLCVSCPACNLEKGDRPIRMWIRIGQQLLEL